MTSHPDQKQLTLDDIFSSDLFRGKTVANIQWMPDGSAFTFTRNKAGGVLDIWQHAVASGQETLVLEGDQLTYEGESVSMTAYQTTGLPDQLLITGARLPIWRHSFSAAYYLYHIPTKTLRALAGGTNLLQNVALAPNGEKVAYVKENNLYVATIADGKETQLSTDGSTNVLNGVFDWVYEEEFQRADALRWSPDSQRVAFWWFDQTQVKTQVLLDELPPYAQPIPLKYPKVGEKNSVVKVGIVALASGKTTWVDLGSDTDIYIPRIEWMNQPDQLMVEHLNRNQNHLEYLQANAATGKTIQLLEEHNQTWVEINDDLRFLKDGQMLRTSEKDGWRHIYLHDLKGGEQQLTQGAWEVVQIEGLDEPGGFVYFSAHREGATEQGLYRVALIGGPILELSAKKGWVNANFSPDGRHYIAYSSTIDTPPTVALHRANGELVRLLEANAIPELKQYRMVYPEFLTVPSSDGVALNGYIIKPADFDPTKKYPVIVFGYGGPGSQMVVNRWGTGPAFRQVQRSLWHQYMTEQGFLVFCVDNRGTGGRGKAFKDLCYGDIAKWAVQDQIDGARYLANLPYVAKDRIGFWGWSGGGYLTCLMMTRAADYFSTGVAVASVGDFRNYDSVWTERYMGLLSENLAGYEAADVLTGTEGLKGSLLLIHGTGDDNVHPGNTWQIIEKLIKENKDFDMMMYPNRNHRIDGGNTSRHLFRQIGAYFIDHL